MRSVSGGKGLSEGLIPADRRGSCCFLLGIVTVTLHGASHAGINTRFKVRVSCGKSSRLFGLWGRRWGQRTRRGSSSKKQRVRREKSLELDQNWLLAVVDSVAGERKEEENHGQEQLLLQCPSKIIFLHFSHGRGEVKRQHDEGGEASFQFGDPGESNNIK